MSSPSKHAKRSSPKSPPRGGAPSCVKPDEVQRSIRKQIDDMDAQLNKELGELEQNLKALNELQAVTEEIAKVEKRLELGHQKELVPCLRRAMKLQTRLRELENVQPVKPPTVRSATPESSSPSDGSLHKGEIKLWFPRKHFGFIAPDNKPEGEPDVFFHGTHVENRKDTPIKRFARVTYAVLPAPKGPQARDVTIISYQPVKEREAEAQEAAKLAAEGRTYGKPVVRTKKSKNKSSRIKKPAAATKPKATSSKKPRRSSIHEIRDSRNKQSTQRSSKVSNQQEHHNWGSISSEMGSMHWGMGSSGSSDPPLPQSSTAQGADHVSL